MIIKPAESRRFFRVWWPLLHFTNREQRILPQSASTAPTKPPPTMEAALRIRDGLWSDPLLLQRFVKENPYDLTVQDLALAESWRHRIEGTFFVFRHLKRHTILIDESDPPRAFAVKGLQSSFADLLGPDVPVAAEAVLLPFGDQIVYDGLLVPYPIVFGSGIRRNLKETYDRIRERDALIESLPPRERTSKRDSAAVERRNMKLLDEFRRHSYVAGRGSATVDRDVAILRALADDRMLRDSPPRGLIEVSPVDIRGGLAGSQADARSVTRFVQFLAETGRVDRDAARATVAATYEKVRPEPARARGR